MDTEGTLRVYNLEVCITLGKQVLADAGELDDVFASEVSLMKTRAMYKVGKHRLARSIFHAMSRHEVPVSIARPIPYICLVHESWIADHAGMSDSTRAARLRYREISRHVSPY